MTAVCLEHSTSYLIFKTSSTSSHWTSVSAPSVMLLSTSSPMQARHSMGRRWSQAARSSLCPERQRSLLAAAPGPSLCSMLLSEETERMSMPAARDVCICTKRLICLDAFNEIDLVGICPIIQLGATKMSVHIWFFPVLSGQNPQYPECHLQSWKRCSKNSTIRGA